MKKHKILIPMPKSRFYKVVCKNCGAENVVFSHATYPARCKVCGTQVVEATGGRSKVVNAEIVSELG